MSQERHEYRVTYRRAGWRTSTANKSRTFDRRADADRFVGKLLAADRPDLTELELLQVDRRVVGRWMADPTVRGRRPARRRPGRRARLRRAG